MLESKNKKNNSKKMTAALLYRGAGSKIGPTLPRSWLTVMSVSKMVCLRKHCKASPIAGGTDIYGYRSPPWRRGHDAHLVVDGLLLGNAADPMSGVLRVPPWTPL
jgi:hypothetical protein